MAFTSMMTPHPICPFVEEDMIALWNAALQSQSSILEDPKGGYRW